jgi:carboxymethylenebutenolidase
MTDLQRYLIEEFVEEYQQGRLTRREALRRIAAVTGSLTLSTSILAACGSSAKPAATTRSGPAPATSDPAASAQSAAIHVSPDDPAIEAGNLQFSGQNVTLLGYLSQPKGDGTSPGVLVCHENRGLTEHIKEVTRRLATAGYVGLAVDLLSRQGGTEAIRDPAQVPGILGNTPSEQFVQDFQSGSRYP